MNSIPKMCILTKRFHPDTGELLDVPLIREPNERRLYKGITELCESIDIPMEYLGKFVSNSNEAKFLTECVLISKKMKFFWTFLIRNMACYQILENLEGCFNGETENDKYTMISWLKIISEDRLINMRSSFYNFSKMMKRLDTLGKSLRDFSTCNIGMYYELKSLNKPECKEILEKRLKLSECEFVLSERIKCLLYGVSNIPEDRLFQSWEEFFSEQMMKRKRDGFKKPSKEVSDKNESDDMDLDVDEVQQQTFTQKQSDEEDEDDGEESSSKRRKIDENPQVQVQEGNDDQIPKTFVDLTEKEGFNRRESVFLDEDEDIDIEDKEEEEGENSTNDDFPKHNVFATQGDSGQFQLGEKNNNEDEIQNDNQQMIQNDNQQMIQNGNQQMIQNDNQQQFQGQMMNNQPPTNQNQMNNQEMTGDFQPPVNQNQMNNDGIVGGFQPGNQNQMNPMNNGGMLGFQTNNFQMENQDEFRNENEQRRHIPFNYDDSRMEEGMEMINHNNSGENMNINNKNSDNLNVNENQVLMSQGGPTMINSRNRYKDQDETMFSQNEFGQYSGNPQFPSNQRFVSPQNQNLGLGFNQQMRFSDRQNDFLPSQLMDEEEEDDIQMKD